jgi:hypothetical protein
MDYKSTMSQVDPKGFFDHCPLILGALPVEKSWIPFKFMDCWLYHPNFKDIIKGIWDEACNEFLGQFKLIKKLNFIAIRLRQWNRIGIGNQETALASIQSNISVIEQKSEYGQLSTVEQNLLDSLIRK